MIQSKQSSGIMRIVNLLTRRHHLLHRQYSSVSGGIPRVAVVGAGPAGFYAAQNILKNLPESRIDIYEALPVPFGLVR